MNPFLILALVIAWFISFGLFWIGYCDYYSGDKPNNFWFYSFIFMLVGVILLIVCGVEWSHLHQ